MEWIDIYEKRYLHELEEIKFNKNLSLNDFNDKLQNNFNKNKYGIKINIFN